MKPSQAKPHQAATWPQHLLPQPAASLTRAHVSALLPAAIHDMNRKQQPKHEQFCEEDWNETSQMPGEAYWVSKVRSSSRKAAAIPTA